MPTAVLVILDSDDARDHVIAEPGFEQVSSETSASREHSEPTLQLLEPKRKTGHSGLKPKPPGKRASVRSTAAPAPTPRHHPLMQPVATTVLALVGAPPVEDLRALAASLGETANVRTVLPEVHAAPLDRAVAAWGEAARAHIPYLVHDADPLDVVAAAWVDRWEGSGELGRLEVAVQDVLRRWRARSLELPDYYLLVDAEALAPTWRHWYLGVLAAAAAHRVVVIGPDPVEALGAVRELRAGRWWPQLDALLADVDRRVPDALQMGEPATGLVL
ncbi:MAG: hypothetical protein M3O70_00440 [Actinomycetota bacterium]|nr:hypothetical protein [Actinomycetota bacterium]